MVDKMNIHRGDIYSASLPTGKDSEQTGRRPVVILSNDVGNRFSPNVIVAAITSSNKKQIPTHIDIDLLNPSTILLEQIFTVSKNRLMKKIGSIPIDKLPALNRGLAISLGLEPAI